MVVFSLGKNLLFKYILGRCDYQRKCRTDNANPVYRILWKVSIIMIHKTFHEISCFDLTYLLCYQSKVQTFLTWFVNDGAASKKTKSTVFPGSLGMEIASIWSSCQEFTAAASLMDHRVCTN